VAPFAGDRVTPLEHRTVDHDAATDAGAEDDAEHDLRIPARAIDRLRQRKTIGVVHQANGTSEKALKISVEWMSDQPSGVGVLHQAGDGRYRSGHTDSDSPTVTCVLVGGLDERLYRLEGSSIIPGGLSAPSEQLGAGLVERNYLDLGTTKIDP